MNIPKLRFKDNNGNDYPQWEKKLIKDILKIYHGKDYKNEPNEKKLYPVLGTGGIITYIDKFLCDWECVLIGRKGTINKPQYMKTPFWSVDTLFYSKPKLKQNPKFQYYLFQNINWKIYDESTGVPSLSASTIEHINRFIPTYAEQEKIASFFSTIDKKIENLTNTITSLENQKKGLLQQIFSQKLRFKDENGNNYPNWEKKKLGDLFTIKAGGDINKENFSEQYSIEFKYPVYANALTNNGLYGYSNIYKIDKPSITVTGRGINVGFALSREPFYYPIVRLLVLIPNININFTFFTESINFIHIFNESTGVPQLTAPQLSKVNVYVPNIEEQNKIGNLFDKLNEKIDNKKAQLEHWQQIKKGLLQQMFV